MGLCVKVHPKKDKHRLGNTALKCNALGCTHTRAAAPCPSSFAY